MPAARSARTCTISGRALATAWWASNGRKTPLLRSLRVREAQLGTLAFRPACPGEADRCPPRTSDYDANWTPVSAYGHLSGGFYSEKRSARFLLWSGA